MFPPGGPGVGHLEREAEDYQWDARSQRHRGHRHLILGHSSMSGNFSWPSLLLTSMLWPTTNPKSDGNGIVPPQRNEGFLMATPRSHPLHHISPQTSPAPPTPQVHVTQYVWVDARANPSVCPGSAQMTSYHLLVDATRVELSRGVRLCSSVMVM